jgi:hypothetical protein
VSRREDQGLEEYVEEVALFFEQGGLPRMAGRIFGWLLVCDPPYQTLDELAAAVRGSKASMSTMTRLLMQLKIAEKVRTPGARKDAWRIRPDAWTATLEDQARLVAVGRALAERGLTLLGRRSADARARLLGFREGYAWLEREMPRLLARWRRLHSGAAGGAFAGGKI